MTGHLVVLVGNIGTGKSTYRKSHFDGDTVTVCPDEWELKEASEIQGRIIKLVEEGLSKRQTVIIDGNNLTRRARDRFLFFARKHGAKATIVDFGMGDQFSLERRAASSPEWSFKQWEEIHSQNQAEYERPEDNEKFDEIIRLN